MSSAKFSPGPWRWDEEYGLRDANDKDLLPIYIGGIDYVARARTPEDARLIAAAPEMLTLLQEMHFRGAISLFLARGNLQTVGAY